LAKLAVPLDITRGQSQPRLWALGLWPPAPTRPAPRQL